MVKNITALICARGGSKGLENKNIKLFCGKPLIAYSIDMALSLPFVEKVDVSTDDKTIATIAATHGASIPFIRPKNLATDNAKELDVWRHYLDQTEKFGQKVENLLVLPVTSPLRRKSDVLACIEAFEESKCDGAVCVTESYRNPEFNMIKFSSDRHVELAIQGQSNYSRRQDAPRYYDLTTICYIFRADFIKKTNHILDGHVKGVTVPRETAVDIDDENDFLWAEFLAKRAHYAVIE